MLSNWPRSAAATDVVEEDKPSSEAATSPLTRSWLPGRVSTNLTVNNNRRRSRERRFINLLEDSCQQISNRIGPKMNSMIIRETATKRRKKTASMSFILTTTMTTACILAALASAQLYERQQPNLHMYRLGQVSPPQPNGRQQQQQTSSPVMINQTPQNWARALSAPPQAGDPLLHDAFPPTTTTATSLMNMAPPTDHTHQPARRSQSASRQQQQPKAVRHIVSAAPPSANLTNSLQDTCSDRLCYGLPQGCQLGAPMEGGRAPSCNVLVTSKRFIDPNRPVARDILFELIALPAPDQGNYAAVGFSETGRMQGLASECLQYRDTKTQVQMIKLKHSYNIAGFYQNVPVKILSGIKNLGVSFEDGHYQCRWIVESAVEFSYEAANGSLVTRREDLGYKNYHILLATGEYSQANDAKSIHTDRVSSMTPISLAQTGHIRSLGAHILIRIHGSLMIAIWVGLVTLSVIMARYYKNEWANSKINDLAIWFVAHRALMLTAWFGSIIAVIFAYMYTETYHPATHQISGTICLVLITIQVIGGLFRPSQESSKRTYFNWTHFICGNLAYLLAMVCLVTAAFLRPAHLPPLYIWVVAFFVATYALAHTMMTAHQYFMHRSSKISITPMSEINSQFVGESYLEDTNSPFRQFMLGILVTIVVIFIVILISLVNIGPGSTGTT